MKEFYGIVMEIKEEGPVSLETFIERVSEGMAVTKGMAQSMIVGLINNHHVEAHPDKDLYIVVME
jgi:hypothetical protein